MSEGKAVKKTFPDEDDDSSDDDSFYDDENALDISSGSVASDRSSASVRLARKETARVNWSRWTVILVLTLAMFAICIVVFLLSRRGETQQFESTYEESAQKILDSFQQVVGQKVAAVASLGVTMTAYARSHNETWPFVTMGDFQEQAANTRSLSGVLFIQLHPIVETKDRSKWEEYSVENNQWIEQGTEYQDTYIDVPPVDGGILKQQMFDFIGRYGPSPRIFAIDDNWNPVEETREGPYYPIWTSSPVLTTPRDLTNLNLVSLAVDRPYMLKTAESGQISLGGMTVEEPGGVDSANLGTNFYAYLMSFAAGKTVQYNGDPMSSIYVPVFDEYDSRTRKIVAMIKSTLNWAIYFRNVLTPNALPVRVILENTCDGAYTYDVSGQEVHYIGPGDLHDSKFNDMVETADFAQWVELEETDHLGFGIHQDLCPYNLRVYPTAELEDDHYTMRPFWITVAVAAVFLFSIGMFFVYDRLVARRQELVMTTAVTNLAVVSNLFPKNVRDRVYAAEEEELAAKKAGTKAKLKSFADGTSQHQERFEQYKSKPIADLYLETTVLFADIAGFTAWSSVREPSQVFTLLETVYRAFDKIAERRKVFKIETVGDCYVAATGLPDPNANHAVSMARFAKDIVVSMSMLVQQLEISLGPDTTDLNIRVGIHSGPVTAGVLRGQRSRFQLFGDTMNIAARMESTSEPGRVQCSEETAKELRLAGKEDWLMQRKVKIQARGKGELTTYFLNVKSKGGGSEPSVTDHGSFMDASDEASARQRLIEWNVQSMMTILKQIVARRKAHAASISKAVTESIKVVNTSFKAEAEKDDGKNTIDEVVEIITLPKYKSKAAAKQEDAASVKLYPEVKKQLQSFVSKIASMYHKNHFHNFEHASHVAMSVQKLLSRIVAPFEYEEDLDTSQKSLHDHTYGITSDPLTHFACFLSALIHDVDHLGIPNSQIVKEALPLAEKYKNQSIAEQNSVDLAWSLLLEDEFQDLRETIYRSESEYKRFRQLVVNGVMATDIVDKELKNLRNARWDKAFTALPSEESPRDAINRKATIVIEHLIQASDVSHTMQHWHIYRKWNERFFMECYKAYYEGRAANDPTENWYKGEMGFFDFYIIPLTKKLKSCGVFGVSSDEYLNYALQNRLEWELRGQEVVAEMVEIAHREIGAPRKPIVAEEED